MEEFQNEAWQRNYMRELADFVTQMAENCESVPEWLTLHPEHKPERLLGAAAEQQEQEEKAEESKE